jgi:group I intron endonuclease
MMGYLPSSAGVYAITHMQSGRQYIGSSVYMGRRWHAHRGALRKGLHYNLLLQRVWTKYGEKAFAFSVLETIENATTDLLIEREQFHLDARRKALGNDGLNLRNEASNPTRHTVSEATRRKISAAKKGRTFTPEHRQKLSEARQRWSSSPAFVASRQAPRPNRRGQRNVWSEEAKMNWKTKRQAQQDAITAKIDETLKRNGRYASRSELLKFALNKRWHPDAPSPL